MTGYEQGAAHATRDATGGSTSRPAARSTGCKVGRRPKLSEHQRAAIVAGVLSGQCSAAEMARHYTVSEPTISRILAAHRAGAEALNAREVPDPGRGYA